MEIREKTLEQSITLKILTDKYIYYSNELISSIQQEKEQIEETMTRLKIYIKRYIENLRNNNEVECAFLLESMLEVTLQLFLYSNIKNYNELNWKKWDINVDKLQQDISQYINKLNIETNKKNTLKELIKQELKIRKNGKKISEMKLEELMELYKSEEILRLVPKDDKDLEEFEPLTTNITIRALLNLTPEEEIEIQKEYIKEEKERRNKLRKQETDTFERMTTIKNSRNNIHIFKEKNLKNIETIIDLTEDYINVLYDLTCRLEHFFEDKREKHQKNLTK